MSLKLSDPLLAAAKILLWFLIVAMGAGGIVALLAVPTIFLLEGRTSLDISLNGRDVDPEALFALVPQAAVFLLILAIILAIVVWTLILLKRVVDSVGEGDPFVPENARRLTLMAWGSVAIQLLSFPLISTVISIVRDGKATGVIDPKETIVLDAGLDPGNLLLILILFILARVFREGARMRADLEGTV